MQQITIYSVDDSEPDCRRTTFYTRNDPDTGLEGRCTVLSACALNTKDAESRARTLFGEDVVISWD